MGFGYDQQRSRQRLCLLRTRPNLRFNPGVASACRETLTLGLTNTVSNFELLSMVLSCVAVLVSLMVWNGQRKLQREANDLQKFTADLSRKQLQLIKEQEQSKFSAKLALSLVKDGRDYKLVLRNKSDVDALTVDLRPTKPALADSFLSESELQEKFPIKRLRGGDEVRLIAAVALGTPSVSEFHVTWKNADGSSAIEDFSVSL